MLPLIMPVDMHADRNVRKQAKQRYWNASNVTCFRSIPIHSRSPRIPDQIPPLNILLVSDNETNATNN